ncbi:hypothetical protein SNOG_05033 [Parastagonospora nodorum SN15]|uniref:Uncharacterized protein n=1 Tax=Phaeosphaeria nodorum (strain SN15 / ATCC MYA-4574 / FGSC 10173) TaxID=321614 RepID=Q0UT81_PHANO|nr:hypothetical protein SNOG_05033 [Parastagonospora nodorum SN15]EAT87424.1 hypothetical protein SNOG_05033 [Parastagonospora nodorum SN15]
MAASLLLGPFVCAASTRGTGAQQLAVVQPLKNIRVVFSLCDQETLDGPETPRVGALVSWSWSWCRLACG